MLPTASEKVRASFGELRSQASETWQRSVVNTSLSLLASEGMEGLRLLEGALTGMAGGALSESDLSEMIASRLSLREASDLLAALENGEAGRVAAAREWVGKVLAVARVAAEELLKAVLGGAL